MELSLSLLFNRLPHWQRFSEVCQHLGLKSLQEVAQAPHIPPLLQSLQSSLNQWKDHIEKDLIWLNQNPLHHCVPFHASSYPSQLRHIVDPPAVLYVYGQLQALNPTPISIVGARAASPLGRHTAYTWSQAFSSQKYTLVSGLAAGIDAAVHEGVLSQSGCSIAVMPAGLLHLTPKKHLNLAQRIIQKGALISEHSPHITPKPYHFPKRNRLISGMTLGTLVVEAQKASGSMITAYQALDQNRTVMAIPGAISHDLSSGCLHLIQQGAECVTSPQHVCTHLNLKAPQPTSNQPPLLHALKAQVLHTIDFSSTDFQTISMRSQLHPQQLLSCLHQLMQEGYIHPFRGGWIRLH